MTRPEAHPDVAVLGAGPAGLLAAAACADVGLDVAVVAPEPEAPWPNRYGVWVDELEPLGLASCLDPIWPRVEVRLDERRAHRLERAYGRVDGGLLQRQLLARCKAGDARLVGGEASRVDHRRGYTRVELGDGDALRCAVVVDATGHAARFTHRTGPGPTAFQTAWGLRAEVRGERLDRNVAILMDFSDPGPGAPPTPDGSPTFLYAMPEPDGAVFFEETTLIGRPEVPPALLRERLMARLAHLGVEVVRTLGREVCRIPMDAPLPDTTQRTLAFGGAASMVHPATGYMLAHTARTAPRLAAALAAGLRRGDGPEQLAAAGWASIWPAAERRRHAFYRFGAEVVLGLDARRTRDFFDAFFRLPRADWSGYLGRDLDAPALARAMLRLQGVMSPAMRARLHLEVARLTGRTIRGWLDAAPGRLRGLVGLGRGGRS